ncbi:hypothetical protein [Bradyrhizobium sp. 153]|uniref:hypothetical protein n=1 Tax=Bradyrhizobium sp. 153 TaxID=2782627 RepID=UPI001FFB53A2|nr:hypothetical protein [Bradyrhizobium sp. 153]MCK1669410.1 hypothetical protein [Bradyrhizobium sp. 153]
MIDLAARIADPEDLRVLVMLAVVLAAGVLVVAAGARMLPRREDAGFGIRVRR